MSANVSGWFEGTLSVQSEHDAGPRSELPAPVKEMCGMKNRRMQKGCRQNYYRNMGHVTYILIVPRAELLLHYDFKV